MLNHPDTRRSNMKGTHQQQQHLEENNDTQQDTMISDVSNLTISTDQKAPTAEPQEEQNKELITTDRSHTNNQHQPGDMKLIVRSQYWGRTLKGKTMRSQASLNRPYRTISAQAVLYNSDEFWGCCPHHGKRVLELQDCHFEDAVPDCNWDLYLVGSWVGEYHAIHDFFLLPQNQAVIDINRNLILSGWSFVGTCTVGTVRADLDGMLRSLLKENENYGYRYHHAHIEIMMDKAFDRETPRSRKMNNEKARQERQHTGGKTTQESSETTDDTASSAERDGPPSVNNNPFVGRSSTAPPIPNVISNDSSSVFSHSIGSPGMHYPPEHLWYSSTDSASYYSTAPPGFHATPNVSVLTDPHHGMQWHPGSALPLPTSSTHHVHHWQHLNGMGSPVPPPPPPLPHHHHSLAIHGQMPSPPMHHPHPHQPMPDLQQYLMYPDPHGVGHFMPHQQQHNHPHQYHAVPFPPPATPDSFGKSIPREILSSTPATCAGSVGTAVTANYMSSPGRNDDTTNVTTIAVPSSNPKNGETTVVTTIANETMVSSTCWTNESNRGLPPIQSESHDSSNSNSP